MFFFEANVDKCYEIKFQGQTVEPGAITEEIVGPGTIKRDNRARGYKRRDSRVRGYKRRENRARGCKGEILEPGAIK